MVNNQESLVLVGELYAAGTRGYSAYEVAQQNGYTGTEEEWLASLEGPEGPRGLTGPEGPIGPTGLTPAFRIGTVTTLPAGDDATASITGTHEVPMLNLGIPKGPKGDTGETGTTDYMGITNKPQINGVTLQGNRTLEELNIQPKGNYLVQADLADYVTKVDYATDNIGGAVKTYTDNGIDITSSGRLYIKYYNYSNYLAKGDNCAISKKTLENVISGKQLTDKAYVDGLVGDLNDVLDSINGEVI